MFVWSFELPGLTVLDLRRSAPPFRPETSGEFMVARRLARDPLHTSLMPPIPRTKSLFELPKRDSQDYRFRNTCSFWIAVSFVEGSLLFISGALASALELREAWKQRGLVEFAYFAGSLFYTFGSYLGFFQVINLGRGAVLTRRRSRTPLPQPCR